MQFYNSLTEKYSEQNLVVVTLVGFKGSAPQEVGAKMLVGEMGRLEGTVGGGKIEAHCIQFALQCFLEKKEMVAQMQSWNLQQDIGMSCGGTVDILFEPIGVKNKWTLCIFGAGHISQEICRVLSSWDSCRVLVFDTRAEWLELLPQDKMHIEAHRVENLAAQVDVLPINSFLISMTQGHATDYPVLLQACKQINSFPFVGVIGSQVKALKIRKQLIEDGIANSVVEKIVSPLGLPIGKDTPQEIAISVISQLLQVRDNLTVVKKSRKNIYS